MSRDAVRVRSRTRSRDIALGIVGLIVVGIVFVIPFLFMLVMAAKDQAEASRFEFSLPTEWRLIENIQEVFDTRNGLLITAFRNSIVLTVASVALIVLVGTMVAFVRKRRRDRVGSLVAGMLLLGLILPPALVPTIYVLQWTGLFKTLLGMILVEVALILPFAVLDLPHVHDGDPARARRGRDHRRRRRPGRCSGGSSSRCCDRRSSRSSSSRRSRSTTTSSIRCTSCRETRTPPCS